MKGKKLSELFFKEAVKPLLEKFFPEMKYSAAITGPGSDVYGFDTVRSMDHDWGPRVLLFLEEPDIVKKQIICGMFSRELPFTFHGYSTNFSEPGEDGTSVSETVSQGKINHRIELFTVENYFEKFLDFDLSRNITVRDWLVFPEHKLLSLVSGVVFHDDLKLENVLDRFRYYPDDVWLYLLSCQWMRISQEEHFMGRCGELEDEIGSRIIAARLVKDIIRLCFLMEKQYAPYIKWLGTAFSGLESSGFLNPVLNSVLKAMNWKTREKHLVRAYEYIAEMHNSLKITKQMKAKADFFHSRPFLVIDGELFAKEIRKQISNPEFESITDYFGSVNQFSDSTDVLESATQRFKSVYQI